MDRKLSRGKYNTPTEPKTAAKTAAAAAAAAKKRFLLLLLPWVV